MNQGNNAPNRWAAGLLNLSGLGLGYLYLRRWRRWGLHFALFLAVLLFGQFTPQLEIAVWVDLALLGLVLWMGVDAVRIAPKSKTALVGRFPAFAVGTLLCALLIFGLAVFYQAGQAAYEGVARLYQTSNYSYARAWLAWYHDTYHLSLAPNLEKARALIVECDMLLRAQELREQGDPAAALEIYQEYLRSYPASGKEEEIRGEMAQAYAEWGAALAAQGEYTLAAEKFRILQTQYPGDPALGKLSAGDHLAWELDFVAQGEYALALEKLGAIDPRDLTPAQQEQLRNALAAAHLGRGQQLTAQGDYPAAEQEFELLRSEFADTPAAENKLAAQVEMEFAWGQALLAQGEYAAAAERLNRVITASQDEQAVQQARESVAQAWLEIGKQAYTEKKFITAMQYLEMVVKESLQTPAGQAASALIPEVYLTWGDELAMQPQTMQMALEKYDKVIAFGAEPFTGLAHQKRLPLLLEIAAYYRDQGGLNLQLAYQAYELALDGYAKDLPDRVFFEGGEAYLGYARALSQQGKFFQSIELLERANNGDYNKHFMLSELNIATQTAWVYIDWANNRVDNSQFALQQLDEAKRIVFENALFDYLDLVQAIRDTQQRLELRVAYEQSDTVWSNIIDKAVQNACLGIPNPSTYLALDGTQGKRVLICPVREETNYDQIVLSRPSYTQLYQYYAARFPAELFYVLVEEDRGSRVAESCEYRIVDGGSGTAVIERIQHWLTVSLRNVLTGETVVRRTFYGDLPECPEHYYFLNGGFKIGGAPPDYGTYNAWVWYYTQFGQDVDPQVASDAWQVEFSREHGCNENGCW